MSLGPTIVVELASAPLGVECIRVPGWSVVIVAGLLTAPRLVREWAASPEG